jgi:hypothetical protein
MLDALEEPPKKENIPASEAGKAKTNNWSLDDITLFTIFTDNQHLKDARRIPRCQS